MHKARRVPRPSLSLWCAYQAGAGRPGAGTGSPCFARSDVENNEARCGQGASGQRAFRVV